MKIIKWWVPKLAVGSVMKSNHGFTLIEVLVALFIFAILSTLLFGAISQVEKNKSLFTQSNETLDEFQKAMTLIQFDFSQVVRGYYLDNKNNPQGSFYANESGLHFDRLGNVNPELLLKQSSIERITYLQVGDHFIRRQAGADQVLLKSVKSVQWRFYGGKGEQFELWPPVQNLRFEIPMAVEIIIDHETRGILEQIVELPFEEYEFVKG